MDGLETVPVDYESEDLPGSVKEFEPVVYKDGSSFCCILGPDPEEGVFGRGNTVREALTDWDVHLRERVNNHAEGDKIAEYVLDSIAASKWVIW